MQAKTTEKEKAIRLRRQGRSYSEILGEVPVSKSTLSLWLREVGLTKPQKQRLTQKKKAAAQRGGDARRLARQKGTQAIYKCSMAEVGKLSKRERWLIGVALYWAEGAKEKKENTGQSVDFGNTDAEMIKFYIQWLIESLGVKSSDITFSLYIHKNHEYRIDEVVGYWKRATGISNFKLNYIYYKKHDPATKRKNIKDTYYGTLRVRVVKSTGLQRKISGWIYGITGAQCRVV